MALGDLAQLRGMRRSPACWIDTLPDEVKMQIAECCHEQDLLRDDRIRQLRKGNVVQPFWRIDAGPATFAEMCEHESPRTVAMLFGV